MIRSLVIALVVCALMAAAPVSADATVAVDANHPVASDEAVSEYERTETVSGQLPQVDATLTVAEDHDDVGLDGPYLDVNSQYIRLEYDEELPRTLRIYIPTEIVRPRVKSGLEAESGGLTADFAPVDDSEYLAMTVRVDGRTNATFVLSAEAGIIWSARETGSEAVNDTTGISLPSLGSDADWRFVEGLNQSQPVALDRRPDNLTMQYDARDGPGREWLAVPQCDDPSEQSVCYYTQGNETIIMTTQSNPPTVRYQRSNDPTADLKSSWRDLRRVPSRLAEQVDSWFGGTNAA